MLELCAGARVCVYVCVCLRVCACLHVHEVDVSYALGTSASEVLDISMSHFMNGSLFGLSGELPLKPQNSASTFPATPVMVSISSIACAFPNEGAVRSVQPPSNLTSNPST